MDLVQTHAVADRYPEVCPHVIKRTPMRMKWEQLTMLHWAYRPDEVQALLPDDLTVETFDGEAWVGLIPFQMRVDIPFMPTMASILHFPETNVRTYVHGRSGEPGVYFFSLEASSLPAVVTARVGYQIPYFWADMSIDEVATSTGEQRFTYRSRRKWPKPRGARSLVEVEVGEAIGPDELSDFDRFLTARWALYGDLGPWISYSKMFHEPWPLHRADVLALDDELVTAAGLSAPVGDPVVHYSPGVNVRCGWPGRG
jgi:uncharacterized protein YqjF (DUF2071 family)